MSATGSAPSAARQSPTPQRIRLDSGWTLDARRSAFLESESLLAVADLHLGYAWAQRARGLLLPVETPDSTAPRLAGLAADYRPRTVAILGDLIHRAVAPEALRPILEGFCQALSGCEIILCTGNHDRRIAEWIAEWALPIRAVREFRAGPCRLLHGDDPPGEGDAASFTLASAAALTVQGHEHPALELGDGHATRVRVPCFLVGDTTMVLPAFSDWASGCIVGRDPFLGASARSARFLTSFACMGPRLLPIPLHPGSARPPAVPASPRGVNVRTPRRTR